MKTVKVKICGITSKLDLKMAVNAGADAIGFVVDIPSSPRNLTLNEAEKLAKLVPIFVNSILVTLLESLETLKRIVEKMKPNGIQIHGEKLPEVSIIREFVPFTRLIKSMHPKLNNVESHLRNSRSFDAVLLDSFVNGKYGGTGKVHDWKLSRNIRDRLNPIPVILAGGLTAFNVTEAVKIVHPYAVDVSTGVESSLGIKDSRKMFEFIKNTKKVKF